VFRSTLASLKPQRTSLAGRCSVGSDEASICGEFLDLWPTRPASPSVIRRDSVMVEKKPICRYLSPLTDSNRRPPAYHRATSRDARASAGRGGHESPEWQEIVRGEVTAGGRCCPRWCSLSVPRRSCGWPPHRRSQGQGVDVRALRPIGQIGREPEPCRLSGNLGRPSSGERFPHGGIGNKLPHHGTNARIVVKRPHPDADRLGMAGVRAEDRRPTVAAKPLSPPPSGGFHIRSFS
jgi:hypothetical protein